MRLSTAVAYLRDHSINAKCRRLAQSGGAAADTPEAHEVLCALMHLKPVKCKDMMVSFGSRGQLIAYPADSQEDYLDWASWAEDWLTGEGAEARCEAVADKYLSAAAARWCIGRLLAQ